jgi:hypothetical protein
VTPPPPPDADSDGVLDADDNCVDVANADQADDDSDDKGNACDYCPETANPGEAGCAASIYEVREGTVTEGTKVQIDDMTVTADSSPDYTTAYIQVLPGDPDYVGDDYAALQLETGGAEPIALDPGDRIDVRGTVEFSGHPYLEVDEIVVQSSGSAPTPIAKTAAQLAPQPAAVNGLLVSVPSLTLGAIKENSLFGGDYWEVNDGMGNDINVQDLFGTLPSACLVGATFSSIVGIAQTGVTTLNDAPSLYPRSAADITPAC